MQKVILSILNNFNIKENDNHLYVCHCMKVKSEDILKSKSTSIEEAMERTKAGTCCTACHRKIKMLISTDKSSSDKNTEILK